MIKKSLIQELVKTRFGKKIGYSAIKKLDSDIEGYLIEKLGKASRKADIAGRIIIKEQDIE
jgi:histone H3/H4